MADPKPIPRPHLGTDDEFRAARQALEAAGYTEESVCQRVGIERISDFKLGQNPGPPPSDTIGLLVWLLLHNEVLPPNLAAKLPVKELRALGLVADPPAHQSLGEGSIASPFILYPMRGIYIASDRTTPFDGISVPAPDDFVYPAIVPNTGLFLDLLPWRDCDNMLDLCAGTGAAAILAAKRGSRTAWSCDIAGRSTHFAEFNCKLNGLDNVTASTGDLYDAAADQTFDLIVAHPPYVPVYKRQFIFDSGGQDGEHIVRGVIEGLPRHLRPGGLFFSLTMASDRRQPLERRIREWLGPQQDEFDVAVISRRIRDPHDYAVQDTARNNRTAEELAEWLEVFKTLEIEKFVYGVIMIQRRDRTRPVFTLRRKAGPTTGVAEHKWLMNWETSVMADGSRRLLDAKPKAVKGARMITGFRLADEGWAPESFRYEVERPFDMELQADGWVAYLLGAANGHLTGAEILAQLQSNGIVAPNTPPSDFADMLAMLISGGFLQV